jgi:hypothetical protein
MRSDDWPADRKPGDPDTAHWRTAAKCYIEGRRMEWTYIIWDPTPGGNVAHVEEHDLTTDDVDPVLQN